MRIVITGALGMLGTDLVNVLKDEHEIYGIDVKKPQTVMSDVRCQILDITDAQKTYEVITKINPDLVIHTAAYTDVDGCEKNIDLAYRINSLGTRNVALACQRFDAALIYISTDYVFDGKKDEPYLEYDQPNPINVYGESKFWGEKFVQSLLTKFYIIRTSGLFGANGKNFVKTILNLVQQKETLKIVDDQITSPTYTKDLAQAIHQLISPAISHKQEAISYLYGVWHITNSGECSWYEFTLEILKLVNSKLKVNSITSGQLNRPAKRPEYSVLNNYCWQLEGFKPLRHWKEALKDYLREETEK